MADALLSLHRVSKFESKASIESIGNWVATHNPRDRIADACRRVDGEHTFPLLCVVDVVLKFSEKSQMDVGPSLATWLHTLPAIPDARMAVSAAAMVLNWIHHGAVSPTCITAGIVRPVDRDGPGERDMHACPVCRLRFASVTTLGSHVEAHRESTARVLARQKGATLGLFLAIDETRKTKRAQAAEIPALASSPLPVDTAHDGTATTSPCCEVCGDRLVKSFSDVHNCFVWENCRRIAVEGEAEHALVLVHDECGANYFDCKQSSRPTKRIKSHAETGSKVNPWTSDEPDGAVIL